MPTAIIGTGGIGSAIAGQLASGGETLQLSSADKESARTLAEAIGEAAVVAVDNLSALQGADVVILALRFSVLKNVIDEIAGALGDKSLVVPSNPVGVDAKARSCDSSPKGDHPAKPSPGGCRQDRASPWRLAPCRPVSSSPRATAHLNRPFCSMSPTTTSTTTKSTG